ncbi:MAG: TetR/AcrR family transcriptional regulator [Firmicutes bacterium]|nr:TetR/AcrR family transcriptional regulator [Bacillota bacterium]
MEHAATPPTMRGKTTRAHIVETAYQLCAEQGLRRLRTRSVAERAGVNIATLHYYFPSKRDLLTAVLDWLLTRFREKGPHRLTLSEELGASVEWASREPAMLAVWYDFWNFSRTDSVFRAMIHDQLLGWRGRLAELSHEPRSSPQATVLLALALGLPIVASTLPELWSEETLTAAVQGWLRRMDGDAENGQEECHAREGNGGSGATRAGQDRLGSGGDRDGRVGGRG